MNAAQIVSVLLESFLIPTSANSDSLSLGRLRGDIPLTGLTPPNKPTSVTGGSINHDKENAGEMDGLMVQHISISQAHVNFSFAGLGVSSSSSNRNSSICSVESMHLACKALLIIVKYRANCLKNLMDLLVNR